MAFAPSKKKELLGHGREPQEAALSLTSMMDMFTIILTFLIMNFSAAGQLSAVPKDFRLPQSIEATPPQPVVNVSLNNEQVAVAGQRIPGMQNYIATPGLQLIPELKQVLDQKAAEIKIQKKAMGKGFEGQINLVVDKNVPFNLLLDVMATCGQSEFAKIKLLVQKKA